MSKLTAKQLRFIDEYLVDLNATGAARRAGYTGTEEALAVTGSRLLRNAKVAEVLKVAMAERGQRTKVKADRVLLELEGLALVDVSEFADVKSPKDLAKLPAKLRHAVVGWSTDRNGNFVLKFAKEAAIGLLGRHHKLFTDLVEVKGLKDIDKRMAAARERVLKRRIMQGTDKGDANGS